MLRSRYRHSCLFVLFIRSLKSFVGKATRRPVRRDLQTRCGSMRNVTPIYLFRIVFGETLVVTKYFVSQDGWTDVRVRGQLDGATGSQTKMYY